MVNIAQLFLEKNCTHVKFSAGTDIGPVLEGLQDNLSKETGNLMKRETLVGSKIKLL